MKFVDDDDDDDDVLGLTTHPSRQEPASRLYTHLYETVFNVYLTNMCS